MVTLSSKCYQYCKCYLYTQLSVIHWSTITFFLFRQIQSLQSSESLVLQDQNVVTIYLIYIKQSCALRTALHSSMEEGTFCVTCQRILQSSYFVLAVELSYIWAFSLFGPFYIIIRSRITQSSLEQRNCVYYRRVRSVLIFPIYFSVTGSVLVDLLH